MNPFPGSAPTAQETAQHRLQEQQSMDAVRRLLNEIETEEDRNIRQSDATAGTETRNLAGIVVVGSLVAIGVIVIGKPSSHSE